MNDLKFAVRQLLKNPGFTAVAVLTLALGIGANTAIFTVINTVLLRPLPFQDSERLAFITSVDSRRPQGKEFTSWPDFSDWRAQNRSFTGMATWAVRDLNLTGVAESSRVRLVLVTADLFTWLGATPKLGRVFEAREGREDSRVAVLSHGLWQRSFGADPNCLGRSLTVNEESYTVVGVMPPRFRFPLQGDAADLWAPIFESQPQSGPFAHRAGRILEVIGRLKPNVTTKEAQAEMTSLAEALRAQYPDTNQHIAVRVIPAVENLVGDVRASLLLLFGAVGCVLAIACVNVANLLLARAATRQREMAVRAAVGASRSRIIRQLLTESLLLALAGGALGGLLAFWGVEALLALSPGNLPRMEEVSPDMRVLGFTLLLSLLTGLIFGLSPAWRASRIDLTTAFKEGRGPGNDSAGHNYFRHTLVVAEIAMALVLLTSAGLLMNSYWRLRQVNPGFDPRNVLAFRLALPDRFSLERSALFYRELQTRLETIPGVSSAAAVLPLPISGDRILSEGPPTQFDIEGQPTPTGEKLLGQGYAAQPGYFRTMGIKLIKGRDFIERDDAKAPLVAIINETLWHRYFPNDDPIGKRIRPGGPWQTNPPAREIIGVVNDVKHTALNADTRPAIYLPFAQDPFPYQFIVMKGEIDPLRLVGEVNKEIQSLQEDMPLFDVKTLDHRFDDSVAGQRFEMVLLTIFSVIALVLTVVGLYGVVSYGVMCRTREIGVRMALGAKRSDVLAMVVRQGIKLTAAGLLIGLAGAVALTRALRNFLFEISATDPATYVCVLVLVLGAALLACVIPARRAANVDPMEALRCE